MNNCLILLGIKHAGKTTIGTFFAKHKNMPFFDIDAIIEQHFGKTCRNIYNQEGVDAFKNAEIKACDILTKSLSNLTPTTHIKAVIATGGGICDNPEALKILHTVGLFVYLNVPKDISFKRILKSAKKDGTLPSYLTKNNPQSENDVKENFYQIYEKRTALYRSVADIIIDTANLSVKKICDKILPSIKKQ